jgi:hypothetical protein
MDKEELVSKQIGAGSLLIDTLDRSEFRVSAAMWFYMSENSEWRLMIASPYVDKNGPKKAYEFIQNILDELPNNVSSGLYRPLSDYLSLNNISLVGTNHELIKLIRTAIRTDQTISQIRFTKNVINNVLIEDALIYRMT